MLTANTTSKIIVHYSLSLKRSAALESPDVATLKTLRLWNLLTVSVKMLKKMAARSELVN
jgi:hypothetical protein